MNKVGVVLVACAAVAFNAQPVFAISAPNFASCYQPDGTLKVAYSSGTHGIPGRSQAYTGSDSVYVLNDQQVLQCYCPQGGAGIQTNWWRVGDLSQSDVDRYIREGWIYIPNGALWGLDEAPYLAFNLDYQCVNGTGGRPPENNGGGTSSTGSSSSTSSSSDNGIGGGGFIESAASFSQILGLADTGNQQWYLLGLLAFAILFNLTVIRIIRKGW